MTCNILAEEEEIMRRSWMCMAALAACLACGDARAQSWPDRRVQVVVPFTAGSSTDIIARTVTQRLSEELGQPFVVENRPGAGGTSDGACRKGRSGRTHDLSMYTSTLTPSTVSANTPYDTSAISTPVATLATTPNILVTAREGHATVQDIVAAAKAKPGALNYASAGLGRLNALSGERFRLAAGIEVVHVPYKGTPEASTEVIAGRVDYYFCPVNAVSPLGR